MEGICAAWQNHGSIVCLVVSKIKGVEEIMSGRAKKTNHGPKQGRRCR